MIQYVSYRELVNPDPASVMGLPDDNVVLNRFTLEGVAKARSQLARNHACFGPVHTQASSTANNRSRCISIFRALRSRLKFPYLLKLKAGRVQHHRQLQRSYLVRLAYF